MLSVTTDGLPVSDRWGGRDYPIGCMGVTHGRAMAVLREVHGRRKGIPWVMGHTRVADYSIVWVVHRRPMICDENLGVGPRRTHGLLCL